MRKCGGWCDSTGTYSQVDFASLYDLLWKDLEEFEDTVSGFVAQRSANGRQDILPGGHLDGEGSQGNT